MKTNKICLITPSHISSNPRLVKEAVALTEASYSIHIIFVQNLFFLIAHDDEILKENPTWTYDVLNNTNKALKNRLVKLVKSVIWKLNLFALKNNLISTTSKLAINKNYHWQLKKAIKTKAHLYIAHNLSALPIAVLASKKNNTKCGFDAEDFHRQEVTNNTNAIEYRLKKSIEDKYLPKVNYLTTASPLINKAYQQIYPNLSPVVINNVFSNRFLQKVNPSTANKVLKLFWFSQTIGQSRGLEDVIQALNKLNNPIIELHLLGNISNEDSAYFNRLASFSINYYTTIPNNELFKFANQFDIGLALEPGFSLNNNIALSNKLFSYLTAGLSIIASETLAQKAFIDNNPEIGKFYPIGDINTLASIINNYNENRDLLNQTKIKALELAKTKYNWEMESIAFLQFIKQILPS